MNIEVSDIALSLKTVLRKTYQIEEVHYLGNFGIVYFGINVHTGQQVVIKEFMPYKLANRDLDGNNVVCKSPGLLRKYEAAKTCFARECKVVEMLKDLKEPYHGCVVPYMDSFCENNTMYLVMERIYGKSLREYIEDNEQYPQRETADMLISIVEQIHKAGVIHCDIKPSNIILDESGKVVLIDFGSACKKNRKSENIAFVSRGYSAPELFHDEEVDEKTDIYSIGAVLYYMLTGYQLPDPDDYEEEEELTAISEFREIGAELEQIILKTLNRKKGERPDSLLELQSNLYQW